MQMRIDTQGIDLPGTGTIEHRVRRSLARLSGRVERVRVMLRDDGGPAGSRDKVCMMRVHLGGCGQVLVVDRSTHLKRALVRGLRRVRSLVARQIKRRRRHQRRLLEADWGEMLPTS